MTSPVWFKLDDSQVTSATASNVSDIVCGILGGLCAIALLMAALFVYQRRRTMKQANGVAFENPSYLREVNMEHVQVSRMRTFTLISSGFHEQIILFPDLRGDAGSGRHRTERQRLAPGAPAVAGRHVRAERIRHRGESVAVRGAEARSRWRWLQAAGVIGFAGGRRQQLTDVVVVDGRAATAAARTLHVNDSFASYQCSVENPKTNKKMTILGLLEKINTCTHHSHTQINRNV